MVRVFICKMNSRIRTQTSHHRHGHGRLVFVRVQGRLRELEGRPAVYNGRRVRVRPWAMVSTYVIINIDNLKTLKKHSCCGVYGMILCWQLYREGFPREAQLPAYQTIRSSPCVNEGLCTDLHLGFLCECLGGFSQ